jgi:ABC-type amino acid transport system permease subunit
MPNDAVLAIVAALVAFGVAWILTRTSDTSQPGWAVRVYLRLFRTTGVSKLRDAAAARSKFPRREAFLATWFLIFFALFGIGLFVWPGAANP